MIYFVVALAAGLLIWWLRRWVKMRRHAQLRARPIPQTWANILLRRVPLYGRLPANLKAELHGLVQVFLEEKRFFGQDGLVITDEIRVIVAAHACVMLLNRAADVYPSFTTILIYPDTYVAQEAVSDGAIYSTNNSVRAGESWFRGPVVLSWRDVEQGSGDPNDGHHVALHEFAHKLDELDGRMDGLPLLNEAEQYRTWAQVLGHEFDVLREGVAKHRKTVMDEYGATSPAEFFAVATETFFEKPGAMKDQHPRLYEELRRFYALDPSDWT